MSETAEKILCTDGGCSASDVMAMMNSANGNNQWTNNPWMYLIFLALFGNGGFGFGNNGNANQSNEIMNRLNELGSQASSNQNTNLMMDAINGNHEALHSIANTLGVSFAQVQGAFGNLQSAITQVGGQVGMTGQQVINSVLLGNKDLTQALQTCCCENKQLVTTMGYEGQLRDQANTAALQSRIDQLANGIQTGFAQVGYAQSQNTNAIIQAGNANTQRIIDQINANTTQDLRDQLAAKDRELLASTIVSQVKSGTCSCNG